MNPDPRQDRRSGFVENTRMSEEETKKAGLQPECEALTKLTSALSGK